MTTLHQFNAGKKKWKIYANTLTSISGDDLKISPYDGNDLILEVSANKQIIFKQGDTSYNLADLSNVASGGIQNGDDVSFGIVDISETLNVTGDIASNGTITASQNVNCSDISCSDISCSHIYHDTLSTTSLKTRTKEYCFNLNYTNNFATVATISRNFTSSNWRSAMVELCIAYSTSNGGGSGGGTYVGNFRYAFQYNGPKTVYIFPVHTVYNNGGYLGVQFAALTPQNEAGGVEVQLRNYRGIKQVVTMSMKVTSLDYFNLT